MEVKWQSVMAETFYVHQELLNMPLYLLFKNTACITKHVNCGGSFLLNRKSDSSEKFYLKAPFPSWLLKGPTLDCPHASNNVCDDMHACMHTYNKRYIRHVGGLNVLAVFISTLLLLYVINKVF